MMLPVQASITSVPVGEELYLRCRENFVMDSKVSPVERENETSRSFTVRYTFNFYVQYDTTGKGLPVMCGNQGQWEYSAAYNESLADGCTETAMCDAPIQVSWDRPRLLDRHVNGTSRNFAVTEVGHLQAT